MDTRSLYVYNQQTKQYAITDKSLTSFVHLKDFIVKTIPQQNNQNNKNEIQIQQQNNNNNNHIVTFTLLITSLPQCYNKDDEVNDADWSQTFKHMSAVATFLEKEEIIEKNTANATATINNFVAVHDPECTGLTCIEEKEKNNNDNGNEEPPSGGEEEEPTREEPTDNGNGGGNGNGNDNNNTAFNIMSSSSLQYCLAIVVMIVVGVVV